MPEPGELIRSLFDALYTRDAAAFEALCDEHVYLALVPSGAGARAEPYLGHRGLREMLEEVADAWDELLLTPTDVQPRGALLIVSGRIHTRSRNLGLKDIPVTWVFRLRNGLVAYGRAFSEPDAALAAAGEAGAASSA
jgi:hypothetical protein